jgi:hypothetical protein
VKKIILAALLLMFLAGSNAYAVTINTFLSTDTSAINTWKDQLGEGVTVLENFENVTPGWYTGSTLTTSIGTFTASGLAGTGQTSYDPNNQAPYFQIRDDNNLYYGRGNTTPGGSRYLDSGDITELKLALGVTVTNIFFFIQDPSDVSAITTITSGLGSYTFNPKLGNAGLYFVGISSDSPITQIVWATTTRNDGYGLDDFSTVTRVFEPPTMLILGMSLVGIAGIGRKKLLKK